MELVARIKNNPAFKKKALWLLFPTGESRPRWWIKAFVNPFYHQKGRGSKIRSSVRLDVVPFHRLSIGKKAVIEDYSVINNGMGDVVIGDHSFIGLHNTIIGPVEIGENVIIAQQVTISGLNHGYEDINTPIKDQSCTAKNIVIGKDSWIGANAVITAGITIGTHTIVAAGSVVTKHVPDYSIVAGNPARVIKLYNFKLAQWEKIQK